MTYTVRTLILFISAASLLLLQGCAPGIATSPDTPAVTAEADDSFISENPDHSCSYFYFLWAKHAENRNEYSEAQQAYEKALICDPKSAYILRKLPLLLIKMGKYQGAAKWLREIIADNPDDLNNRILLAQLDVRNNEIEEAIQLYKDVIQLNPDDETTYLRLGIIYSKQLRYNEAEKTFKKALSLNKESFYCRLYLARLKTKTGDLDSAEKYYREALDRIWSSELAVEMAEFYSASAKYDSAEALYHSILSKNPDNEQIGLALVQTLLVQEKEKQALQVLQNLEQISEDPERIILIRCRVYLRDNALDKAAELLQSILNNDEAAYMLAVIYYEQKKRDKTLQTLKRIPSGSAYFQDSVSLQVRMFMEDNEEEKAITLLNRVVADKVDSSPALYALLASLYMEQKQKENSYKTLNKALETFPDNAELYFEYGLLLEQDGKQAQAIQSMEKVLELQPDHAEALNYLGYTWANNNINLDKALEYIQRSLSLKPDNGYILDSLGWVYFRMGEYEKAVAEIHKALQLEPKDPHIYEHLGDIYLKQGSKADALKAYQQAEKLFDDRIKKKRAADKINTLKME